MLCPQCLLLPCTRTEAGLSSAPCVKDMLREHLNISSFPVFFSSFLVKPVFDLIGKEVVIMKLTKWQIPLNNAFRGVREHILKEEKSLCLLESELCCKISTCLVR